MLTQSSIFLKSKEEAMPHVMAWLARTYEEKAGSMLLKKDVHEAYSAFCVEHRFETTTNAAFGKMFKRVFPTAEVRRLVKHNNTVFFYENMASKESGQASRGPLTSPSSISRDSGGDSAPSGAHPPGSPSSSSSSDQEPSDAVRAQHLQYRVKKMTLTSSHSPTSSTTTTPTLGGPHVSGEKRPKREGSHSPQKGRGSAPGGKEKGTAVRGGSQGANKRHKGTTAKGGAECEEEEEVEYLSITNGGWVSSDGANPRLRGSPDPVQGMTATIQNGSQHVATELQRGAPTGHLSAWEREAQLGFADTLHHFCELYRNEMWGFCPINPALLEYASLSYIFNTEDGAAERSALSVSAHFVVSIGYLLLGDVTHGREFFCKAREHLSYVFDSSHYDVACMLKHMAWAAIVFSGTGQEGSDRETYYLSLCKNMCQMLGVENDGLFLGTLKMMAIRDRNASHEMDIQKALSTPRYHNGWKDTGPLAMHIQFNELHTHQLLERYKNIVLLAEAARQGHPQLAEQVHQGFTQELREIQRLEESFQRIYGDRPPARLYALYVSCALVFRTIVYNYLNNFEAALQHLLGLVRHFGRIEAAAVAIIITEFSCRGLFSREVVNVLLRHHRYDQLDQLVQIMQPMRRHFYWIDAELILLERSTSEPARAMGNETHYPLPSFHPSAAASFPLPSFAPLTSSYPSEEPQYNSLPHLPPTQRGRQPSIDRSPSQLFPYNFTMPAQLPEFRETLRHGEGILPPFLHPNDTVPDTQPGRYITKHEPGPE